MTEHEKPQACSDDAKEALDALATHIKEHGIPNLGETLQLGKHRVVMTSLNMTHTDGPITLPVSYKP